MPKTIRLRCPECGHDLVRRPAGRCPACGSDVRDHVLAARRREERIEKVVAVLGSFLVVAVMVLGGGCGLTEGVLAWIAGGALVWLWGRHTFVVDDEDDS